MLDRPLILFDGVCTLCNTSVQWIIRRDRRGQFDFAALQSAAAAQALANAQHRFGTGIPVDPESVVLIDTQGIHTHSTAAIRIAAYLGFPWSLARVGLIVPRPLRDALYRWVARNRYRWFGRRDACMMPTPELRARFLDAAETTPRQV